MKNRPDIRRLLWAFGARYRNEDVDMNGLYKFAKMLITRSLYAATAMVAFAANTGLALADIALKNPRAFPENIVADHNGNLYVSNMAEGGVVRVRKGRASMWIKPGASGSGATFGMMIQPEAKLFWLCSNDLSAMKLMKSASGRSALMAFDLSTGKGKLSVDFPDDRADCNDIALGKDGTIYVTDGRSARIFRLPAGKRSLELFSEDPRLQDNGYGVDGIAMGDEGALYLTTAPSGKLLRLEILNGTAGRLTELALEKPLGAADTIRHESGNRFIAVSHAGLERLTIVGDSAAVQSLRKGLTGPSGVAILGSEAFVSEGQAARLLSGQSPSLPFILRKVSLRTQ
jgi:hypothetical protein